MSQIFSFQSRRIRTLTENNETWFAAIDVCRALTIPWRGNTLSSIPEEWKRTMRKFRMEGFPARDLVLISEPAVYKLAFRSNKPEADAFTNWVASEVLPAIRKTGHYSTDTRRACKALPSAPVQPSIYQFDKERYLAFAEECREAHAEVVRILKRLEKRCSLLFTILSNEVWKEIPSDSHVHRESLYMLMGGGIRIIDKCQTALMAPEEELSDDHNPACDLLKHAKGLFG